MIPPGLRGQTGGNDWRTHVRAGSDVRACIRYRSRSRFAQANLFHTHLVASEDFDAQPVAFHNLARRWDAAKPFGYHAADGSRSGFVRTYAEEGGNTGEIEISGYNVAAVAVLGNIGTGLVFIANFAQNDLDQVLHGDQAGGVAVFVNHDHHVGALGLHLTHQIVYGLGLGHEPDWPHQLAHGLDRPLVLLELEHVADVHKSDDGVDAA